MDIEVETRPMKGETANGDYYIIYRSEDLKMVSVIDGLGHGPMAQEASQTAAQLLGENAEKDLGAIFDVVDKGLKHTRGVAVSILKFNVNNNRVECAGIGNVDIHSTNPEIKPISYGGVLGHTWRRPKVFHYTYKAGDLLVVFTDGISTRFDIHDYKNLDCERIAKRILDEHGKDHDDATVMVIRT